MCVGEEKGLEDFFFTLSRNIIAAADKVPLTEIMITPAFLTHSVTQPGPNFAPDDDSGRGEGDGVHLLGAHHRLAIWWVREGKKKTPRGLGALCANCYRGGRIVENFQLGPKKSAARRID